jgi:hypothetical protein
MDDIFNMLTNYGWDTATNRFRDHAGAGNKPCTFPGLVNEMVKGGVVLFHSHGPERAQGLVALKYLNSMRQAAAWITDPQTQQLYPSAAGLVVEDGTKLGDRPGKWGVYAPAAWFAANWRTPLTTNEPIVMFMSCFSAVGRPSIMLSAGGRATSGYLNAVGHNDVVRDTKRILQRLTGQAVVGLPNEARGLSRTWGRALLANGLSAGFASSGGELSKWATLNPAPARFPCTNGQGQLQYIQAAFKAVDGEGAGFAGYFKKGDRDIPCMKSVESANGQGATFMIRLCMPTFLLSGVIAVGAAGWILAAPDPAAAPVSPA